MNPSPETEAKTIPTREGIEAKHRWDLTDLYPDEEQWESELTEVQKLVPTAVQFKGRLATSPDLLYRCLDTRSDLARRIGRLYVYAHLSRDLDSRVSKYQAMVERAAMLSAQVGVMARGASSIFSMLNDADLVYPTIRDEAGHEVRLTKQRYARFQESRDRRVRRDAYLGFHRVYQDHLNTLGASLTASVNKDVFYTRARQYESCLHHALDNDNIPPAVYHSLIETTEANLEALHRYTRVRTRVLKLDQINAWDLLCPLFFERDYEIGYDDAVNEILEAVAPLGDRYRSLLEQGLSARWVDVFETQGKAGGAYSTSVYGVHPYVLMNYNNTIDNMFTLAHEMGHALHSHLANEAQPYSKAHYSIFVAEVASTLNEGLLLHNLLAKATGREDRLFLLNRAIDNAVGTLFYQTLLAHFEWLIHEEVEQGRALSPDTLNRLYGELVRKYYGPDFDMDEYAYIKWSRIPHFYGMYYVYQYATSFAASQMVLRMIIEGENGLVDRYLRLLSAGGSDYPIELLKICGVDMTRPEAVEAALSGFAEQVDELDRLA
jgi:oligoendopeptidase F